MATAGDGRVSYESSGRKRPFRPGASYDRPSNVINEEPQNVAQVAGRNNCTEIKTDQGGISELEQVLKQKTLTRAEIQRLIALLNSKITEATSNDEMISPQEPAVMGKLSGDVLSNILIRLPAKQLAQMRCVSKPLNSLLSQPSFIKSHLDRSMHFNDGIILLGFDFAEFVREPFKLNPCRSPHPELPDSIKPPVNHSYDDSCGTIIGSINGLVCFVIYHSNDYTIYIWNPSLSALLTLPPYTLPLPDLDDYLFEIHFRFGYDPKSDDYKIVKLTSYCPPSAVLFNYGQPGTYFNVVRVSLQVEIYSMRKGCWEVITQRYPSHVTVILDTDEVCVDGRDGHLHWLGFNGEEKTLQTIVVFDLSVEAFSEISLPDSFVGYGVNHRIVLGALGGKLCVMSCIKDGGECEVWVMDEYGVAESWVKRHVFSRLSVDLIPYGFTLDDELIFREYYDHRLVAYDPVAAKFKSLQIVVLGDKSIWYVDSLVWIAPAKR